MKAILVTSLLSLLAMAPCSNALTGGYSPEALCCHTNYYRAKYGGSSFSHPYYFSSSLSAVTQKQAEDMATQNQMVHNGLGAGNAKSFDRITRVQTIGMDIERTGENIADKYQSMKDVTLGWWESPDHQEHMSYTQEHVVCGSGHAISKDTGRDYWAQDFAILKGDISNRGLQILDCSGVFAEYGMEAPKPTQETETQTKPTATTSSATASTTPTSSDPASTTPTSSDSVSSTATSSASAPPTSTPTDDGNTSGPGLPGGEQGPVPPTKPPGKCKKCRKCKKKSALRRSEL
ncbi:hypothetical protein IWQ62_000115 [Dispira parvispora]|uniref:SCP domain-containing protein n=1 Tax=Dispira parvispora TaxID=1520584 RepID=A0A9W8B1B3_9FUNG|nr:hypothetical protein IWQ62_000115 [Dispira parvispora]